MTPSHDWKRAALGMGAITAVSRVIGFVRVLVVAAVLGTTFLGNAFQGANSVSNVLFELLAAGALSAVLVPTFVALLERGDDAEADRLASGLLGGALLVLGTVSIVGIIGAPLLSRLLTIGVDDAGVAVAQRDVSTFLLRFFVPQIMLYAYGAVATALLYARRRFALTAAAPIGNTIVMVVGLLAFRAAAGSHPGLDLTTVERLWLVAAGTGGVGAFVGVLVVGARRAGFSLRPRWPHRDPQLLKLLRLSGWGVLLHANAGLLLGAAIVLGGAVAGGVVAYQVAFVFFLAPYAVLAQPIHTALLPELSADAARGDLDEFAKAVRHALDRMAIFVVPASAVMVAIALPAMRVLAFGRAEGAGVGLLAAGLATLAVGLFPYGAFLLLARAYYALDDSRTPALAAIASALLGVAVMVTVARPANGAARVAALGLGHSAAYVFGAVILMTGLARRIEHGVVPRVLPLVGVVSATLGIAMWSIVRAIDPAGRMETIGVLAIAVVFAGAIYSLCTRRLLRMPTPVGVAR